MRYEYLYIGGAPKCGTSAIFGLLESHPAIVGSRPKETFFFLPGEHPLLNKETNIHKDGIKAFDGFFRRKEASFRLEATTHTLYYPECADSMTTAGPSKFVFVLRNPIDRLRSSFEYTLNNLAGFRKELSFDAYVDMLLSGREEELEEYMDPSPSLFVLKRDLQYGQYVDYLEAWQKAVGPENVGVIIYEDFKRSGETVISEIYSWVGLPAHEVEDPAKSRNQTRAIRNKCVHRLAQSLSAVVPSGGLKKIAKKMYYAVQSGSAERIQPDTVTRDRLLEHYKPYNDRLQRLTGKDLKEWK